MPSKYWIKLYHEIIDDPKMGRLSDRLYRRTIQLFLLAGELDEDGRIPEVDDIAWRLRCDIDELEAEMNELQSLQILSRIDGCWIVTKFLARQAPVPGAERVARFRDRKRKDTYYGTTEKQTSNVNVTKCYTDTDTDIDTEIDKGEELNGVTADAETPEPPPKKTKKGKKRDPLLDHPAIIAYREEFHYHVQIAWREEVCSTVDDPEKWKTVIHDWHGCGWNPKNVKGMLEAYRNGGIGKRKEEPAGFEALRNYRQKQGLDNGE